MSFTNRFIRQKEKVVRFQHANEERAGGTAVRVCAWRTFNRLTSSSSENSSLCTDIVKHIRYQYQLTAIGVPQGMVARCSTSLVTVFSIKYTQALLLFELLTMDNDPLFNPVSYSFPDKFLGLPVDFPAGFIILCEFVPSSDHFYGIFLCWSCLTVPRNWHGVFPKPSKHFFAAARGFYGKQIWLRQDYPMQDSKQVFLFSPLGQGESSGNIPSKEPCFMLQEPHASRQHGCEFEQTTSGEEYSP